ncbi:MAG TPA: DUF6622 family protein [Hydrogenophaga sp.]
MLLQLLTHQPSAIVDILHQTPVWVWGLLIGLIALGASQLRRRQVGLPRTVLLPASMAALSVQGLHSALASSPSLLPAMGLWALVAAATTAAALAWRSAPPAGSHFDATQRRFDLPGSAMPLLLILAIFLTKYGVGVELAMQPQHLQNSRFVYGLAATYGAFNGILFARALRLWRLVQPTAVNPLTRTT